MTKRILNRNLIQTELLTLDLPSATKQCIAQGGFYIVEDICVEIMDYIGKYGSFFKIGEYRNLNMYHLFTTKLLQGAEKERFLSKDYTNAKMYFVHESKKDSIVAVYTCADNYIPDEALMKKASHSPIVSLEPRGVISVNFLNSLRKSLLKNPTNDQYKIHCAVCFKKEYQGGSDEPDIFTFYFKNGQFNFTMTLNGERVVDKNGKFMPDNRETCAKVKRNKLYYIVEVNNKLKYVFSADDWTLSNEFNIFGPIPYKPEARRKFLQYLQPFVKKGLVREVYANDAVSVLNFADYIYAITNYIEDDGIFTLVFGDHNLVKTFFKTPKALPVIIYSNRKVPLANVLYEEMIVHSYNTKLNGPGRKIDLKMEEDIKKHFQGDIFAY